MMNIVSISNGKMCPDGFSGHVIFEDGTKYLSYELNKCNKVTELTIPSSVKCIGSGFFEKIKNNFIINYLGTIDEWLQISCGSKAQFFYDLYIGGEKVTDVIIPLSFTSVRSYAFHHSTIRSVTFHESLNCIGANAFSNTLLRTVSLNEGLLRTENYAFYGCPLLQDVRIPSTLVRVGPFSFKDCHSLKNIIVADGNINYSSVSGILYANERRVLVQAPCNLNGQVDLPSCCELIEQYAFSSFHGNLDIRLPKRSAIYIWKEELLKVQGLRFVADEEDTAYYHAQGFPGNGASGSLVHREVPFIEPIMPVRIIRPVANSTAEDNNYNGVAKNEDKTTFQISTLAAVNSGMAKETVISKQPNTIQIESVGAVKDMDTKQKESKKKSFWSKLFK